MPDLPVGHRGKPGEDVAQIGVGIDAAAAATLDNSVEDGAALAGVGIAEKQPVLFAESGRPDGVFHQVIMYALEKVSKSSGFKSRLATSLQPEALGAVQEVTNELKSCPKRSLKRRSASHAGCNVSEHRAGLERSSWKPIRHNNGEGRRSPAAERNAAWGSTGVVVVARMGVDMDATREVCRNGEQSGFRRFNNPAREGGVGFGR